jgi:hypothetical protein
VSIEWESEEAANKRESEEAANKRESEEAANKRESEEAANKRESKEAANKLESEEAANESVLCQSSGKAMSDEAQANHLHAVHPQIVSREHQGGELVSKATTVRNDPLRLQRQENVIAESLSIHLSIYLSISPDTLDAVHNSIDRDAPNSPNPTLSPV